MIQSVGLVEAASILRDIASLTLDAGKGATNLRIGLLLLSPADARTLIGASRCVLVASSFCLESS
jgi:hypothetical protein